MIKDVFRKNNNLVNTVNMNNKWTHLDLNTKEIYEEANKKLHIKNKSVFIEHVKGYVGLGEISIIIAVACPHRVEAYD